MEHNFHSAIQTNLFEKINRSKQYTTIILVKREKLSMVAYLIHLYNSKSIIKTIFVCF